MNPVATSDAAFRGGACPTPEYTIAYTGNYTTSADANERRARRARTMVQLRVTRAMKVGHCLEQPARRSRRLLLVPATSVMAHRRLASMMEHIASSQEPIASFRLLPWAARANVLLPMGLCRCIIKARLDRAPTSNGACSIPLVSTLAQVAITIPCREFARLTPVKLLR